MLIRGSAPAERANWTPCALTSPRPANVMSGEPSTSNVSDKSIREPTIPSINKPPQRAPNPVEEIVAEPASKMPWTSITASDAIRNSTPSFTVIRVV